MLTSVAHTHLRRAVCAATVSTAACLIIAPASQATIVPQKSVAGVKLGDSSMQVQATAGQPASQEMVHSETTGQVLAYRYPAFTVFFHEDGVISVNVTGRAQRTSRRVGVGSTRAQVLRRVPGAHCTPPGSKYPHCWVGFYRIGRIVTNFVLRKGRVGEIDLSRVMD